MKYIKLMRVKHWLKNLLIFLPLIFSELLFSYSNFMCVSLSYISFCFIASVVYIINDINDIEKDKKHPVKCKRPLAEGSVTKKSAIILSIFLFVLAFIILYFASSHFIESVICLLIYFLLNVWYSFGAKNIPILDIAILASGFLIRVIYGGILINVKISAWLYLTVLSISFFFALGKRRNELISYLGDTRKVLRYYDIDFLDKFMYLCLTITIVFYSLWTSDKDVINNFGGQLIYTVPLIIVICMKYTLIIEVNAKELKDGDPIEVLLADKTLISLVLFYIIFLFCIIYV